MDHMYIEEKKKSGIKKPIGGFERSIAKN